MSLAGLALRFAAAALFGAAAAILLGGYATPAMTLALDAMAFCF